MLASVREPESVLARRLEQTRFRAIEAFAPKNHLHTFRPAHPGDVDATFLAWMCEACAVGAQHHLH